MSRKQRTAHGRQTARRNMNVIAPEQVKVDPAIQRQFEAIPKARGVERQEVIAALSDALVAHFVIQGVSVDAYAERPWVAAAKQMEETFGALASAHSIPMSSADFNDLLHGHFYHTSGEVDARIRDTVGLTTLSALSYCAFQIDGGRQSMMDFACQVEAPVAVAA